MTVKKVALIIIFAMVLTLLVACGDTSPSVSSNNPNTIQMVASSFSKSSITISKGSTITFVDDPNNGALHILVLGQNGQQDSENGAVDFNGTSGQRLNIGDTWTTHPWNTAGTYHVTCTVHPTMNLIITVTP